MGSSTIKKQRFITAILVRDEEGNCNEVEAAVQRDTEKKRACNDIGITLIEIPYWWDETISSLAATIKKCWYLQKNI